MIGRAALAIMAKFGLSAEQANELSEAIEEDLKDSPQVLQKEVIEAHGNLTEQFKEWWWLYPHKIGKALAATAYKAALTRASQEQLVEGLKRYIKNKAADCPWCNPATWLQQDRWLDEPAIQPGMKVMQNGKVVGFVGPKPVTSEGTEALLKWKAQQLEKEAAHPNPLAKEKGKEKFHSLSDILKVRNQVLKGLAGKPEPDGAA